MYSGISVKTSNNANLEVTDACVFNLQDLENVQLFRIIRLKFTMGPLSVLTLIDNYLTRRTIKTR